MTLTDPAIASAKAAIHGLATQTVTSWDNAPVVIGATGGSGTRAVHAALSALGLFMGERVNGAGDAMDYEPFLDQWINRLIARRNRLDYSLDDLSWFQRFQVRRAFDKARRQYQVERPAGQRWGWKNPRTMYVLPVIADRFPDFRFLHVVRDGRDMALSDNQNQRRKHYEALFGDQAGERDTPAASARLWAAANMQAADWGEVSLGGHYHRVRLEDLCHRPKATIDGIAAWLQLDLGAEAEAVIEAACATIATPASLGRWQQGDPAEQHRITQAAETALKRFGYLG